MAEVLAVRLPERMVAQGLATRGVWATAAVAVLTMITLVARAGLAALQAAAEAEGLARIAGSAVRAVLGIEAKSACGVGNYAFRDTR